MREMAPPAQIRPATAEDARCLAQIDELVNGRGRATRRFAAACDAPAGHAGDGGGETALVLEVGSRVAGFLLFSRVLDEASIHDIAVHPDLQGRGLGRLLLQGALRHMKQAGAARCLLEVRESNRAARRLYGSARFHTDGVRKNYYPVQGGREDALLMSRQL